MTWNAENTEKLKTLWEQGRTAAEIGRRLGKTRNSIISKARNLKIKHGSAGAAVKVVKTKSEGATLAAREWKSKSYSAKRHKHSEIAKKAFGKKKNLIDLLPNECSWPIGDPQDADFHYCGAKVCKKPYCENHRAIAYQNAPNTPIED